MTVVSIKINLILDVSAHMSLSHGPYPLFHAVPVLHRDAGIISQQMTCYTISLQNHRNFCFDIVTMIGAEKLSLFA